MIKNDESTSLPPINFERNIWPHIEAMLADACLEFCKLMIWLNERPQGAEPLSQEQTMEMVEDFRLEVRERSKDPVVSPLLPIRLPWIGMFADCRTDASHELALALKGQHNAGQLHIL